MQNNNGIVLIIAYFGKLPNYFNLFLFSLKYNPQIDVLLYTDQKIENVLPNLIIKNCTFQEFKERVQSKFDFEITLEKPYKICDYKPAFGLIFEEDIADYDFWGHCDIDMLFGDVVKFIPQNIYNTYDKIYQHGHLTLYRNSKENNVRFMSEVGMNYQEVFTTDIICVFDEVIGMQLKYDKLNILTYKQRDCADIDPWSDKFIRAQSYLSESQKENFNYKYQLFFWQNGKIYRAAYDNGEILYDEFNYLHFQKREMPYEFEINDNLSSFFITKFGFIKRESGFDITLKDIKKYNGLNIFREFKYKLKHFKFVWKRRINKYIFKK